MHMRQLPYQLINMTEEKRQRVDFNSDNEEPQKQRLLKKSMLMKSFANVKDNRGNCAMEQSEFLTKQKLMGKRAMYKLLLVTGISFVFMIGEIIGGYWSGSLAIITDAAHMLSDVAGFLISYFAIYMGSRPANYQMSFGYHRAEILGALASIMLIWGIIIYLFIEAIHRIVDPEEIDGEIMLITACVGLGCNLISIFTLHSCGGGHGHHHHNHDEHSHETKEEGRKLSHCHQPALQGTKKNKKKHVHTHDEEQTKMITGIPEMTQNTEADKNVVLLYEDEKANRQTNPSGARPLNYSVMLSDTSSSNVFGERKTVVTSEIEELTPTGSKSSHTHKEGCSHDHKHDHHDHKHDHHDHKHDHKHDEEKGHNHDHHGHKHDEKKHDDHGHHHHGIGGHHGHDHENMNIRAAIIHIIGDIVQSIGVVIASLIIYFYPQAKIADPLCTILFTVLCIFTTIPIFRDCMSVLMEATPKQLDILQCFTDILEIDEVEEIHDFHVWALTAGKLSMSGHIRSAQPELALKKATQILRDKYSIFHTTIQIEKTHPGVEIGCCDNDHEDHNHERQITDEVKSLFVTGAIIKAPGEHDHHEHGHKCNHDHNEHKHDHKEHKHDHGHKHEHGHSHGHGAHEHKHHDDHHDHHDHDHHDEHKH